MRRREQNIETLAKILEIREIHRFTAEMQVAGANAVLHDLNAQRGLSVERLTQQEFSWSNQISAASFSMPLAAAWAAAIANSEAVKARLETEIVGAELHRSQRTDQWRAAIARVDATLRLKRSATKHLIRIADEAALADMADRAAEKAVTVR